MKCYVFILIVVFFLACSHRQRQLPQILSMQEMENVMWDIILADEFAETELVKDSSKDLNTERLKLYLEVFKLHRTTQLDFSASMKYYSARPDRMKTIIDSLAAKGEREQKKLIPR